MAIIKQYHKDTDTTYVYDSVSYWDAEKGQSRSKRKLLGKIDPETGEIVPTGRRGPKPKQVSNTPATEFYMQQDLAERNRKLELTVSQQKLEIEQLTKEKERLSASLARIRLQLNKCLEECDIK